MATVAEETAEEATVAEETAEEATVATMVAEATVRWWRRRQRGWAHAVEASGKSRILVVSDSVF